MKLDLINWSLLEGADDWTVHLGANSPSISPAGDSTQFTEAAYAGYMPAIWDPTPIGINGINQAVAVPGSVSFAGPASGSATVQSCFVMYTDPNGVPQLLESFILAGAPIVLSSPTTTVVVNLALDDFDFNL
jgi:hypothetical protein